MLMNYKEERRAAYKDGHPRTDGVYYRQINIFDGGQEVGEIGGFFDASGNPAVDRWGHKVEKPLHISYRTLTFGSPDTRSVGDARNVAEAKKLFADWYAEHKKEVYHGDVRVLPASPDSEFFPTPSALGGKMMGMVDWKNVSSILEPSAGKGDLLGYAVKCFRNMHQHWRDDAVFEYIDAIELDSNLRTILKGNGYRVVSDDFLGFFTMKSYDLIVMNPPFSNGDEHLLKAISMQKETGGQIVCLLNAETIRNPFTQRRKVLANELAKYEARIEFVEGAFKRAERKSDVEVAIVYIKFPRPERSSVIFENLKKAEKTKEEEFEVKDLVAGDWMDQLVKGYEMEAKLGVALMREYNALAPYIMSGTSGYAEPLIQLSVGGNSYRSADSDAVNQYLRNLRSKYWETLLSRPELTEKMTSTLLREYHDKIRKLKDFDFSRYNIQQVMLEISAQLSRGVEDSIFKLFDELSAEHAWYPECANNVHYYNGWATNKAHRVGMKVILPISGYRTRYDGKKEISAYELSKKIADIERALNYLDRGETSSSIDPTVVAQKAELCQQNTMYFKYFKATFYKKGTCHIVFDDSAKRLIDRLNIFAARGRQWLPPDYGKKHYDDLDEETRAVVDGFQGKDEYEKVVANPQNYILNPAQTMPLLTA